MIASAEGDVEHLIMNGSLVYGRPQVISYTTWSTM